MKRQNLWLLMVVLLLALSACSTTKETIVESQVPVKEMADQMLKQVEQPAFIELEKDQIKEIYYFDPAILDEYTIRMPMMNVKSNEMAILKVKDQKDLATVKSAAKKRAEDVIKSFETYLPDQFENAKNYKIVTKGNYVLFVISDQADELIKNFDTYFAKK